jgi:hypothetical protein
MLLLQLPHLPLELRQMFRTHLLGDLELVLGLLHELVTGIATLVLDERQ